MNFLLAFLMGGALCFIAQLLIDLTSLTPGRIMVLFVVFGVFLGAVGVYEPLFEVFGCGVSVPLLGFGGSIAKGVKEAVDSFGVGGILKGAFNSASLGLSSALIFGLLYSFITSGRQKRPG